VVFIFKLSSVANVYNIYSLFFANCVNFWPWTNQSRIIEASSNQSAKL